MRQPTSPPPSGKARELLDEAQRWIDQEAPEMAEVLIAQDGRSWLDPSLGEDTNGH